MRTGAATGRKVSLMSPASEAELIAWVLTEAVRNNDGDALLAGFGERLLALGMPVWRINMSVPTISPTLRGISLIWKRDEPFAVEETLHAQHPLQWQQSPIAALLEQDRMVGRWRLEGNEDWPHPLLHDLRDAGGTDYTLFIVAFPDDSALKGVALSFTTQRPGGFTDAEVDTLGRFVPAMALATARINLWYATHNALGTYLGPMTAERVLAGSIQRGMGERIEAAILLADLAGFTACADGHDASDVIAWLNGHLDALGGAVIAHGGEILKFLGDGFLAVFPATEAVSPDCAACRAALAAAEDAVRANRALNARRLAGGEPALRGDVVLHFGEVVYGNIGTERRLDFTVIGRAVNEASRIEKLCDDLGRDLLVSDSFAARCGGRELVPLGEHALRGVAERRRVWGVA